MQLRVSPSLRALFSVQPSIWAISQRESGSKKHAVDVWLHRARVEWMYWSLYELKLGLQNDKLWSSAYMRGCWQGGSNEIEEE